MTKRYFICLLCLSLIVSSFFPVNLQARTRNGLDVSEWQGTITWRKVARTGVRYVYIRACVGNRFVDSQFRRNHRYARRNKIKTGFYHYVTARTTAQARQQARFFARTIKPYRYNMKPAMDFETFGALSKKEINRIALAYLRELEKRTGRRPVIYSDSNNAVNTFTDRRLTRYPLWVAAYGVKNPPVGNWRSYAGWQFADDGRIDGIRDENVDLDYFRPRVLLKNQR